MAKGRTTNKNGRTPAKLTYAVPSRAGRNSIGNAGGHADDAQYAHALVNPFAPEAKGVKLPDDDSARSSAFQLRSALTIDTDAEGDFAVSFRPSLGFCSTLATSVTPGSVVSWASAVELSGYSAVETAFAKYRIVSWGVRIYPLLAPDNQSGYIRVLTTAADPTDDAPFVTSGGFFSEVHDYPVANADIHWVSKPVGVGYKEYIAINGTQSWDIATFTGSGLPASITGAMRFEIVVNVEGLMAFGSISGALSTPAADHSPRVLAAADHARNRVSNAQKADSNGFLSKLWGAAKQGLVMAAHTYGTPLLGAAANAFLNRGYQAKAIMGPSAIDVD
jgi:hypothetical protein